MSDESTECVLPSTHSTQLPGGEGTRSGGRPDRAALLARARGLLAAGRIAPDALPAVGLVDHDVLNHRELVRRFGRFPHRNAILGRVSTPEELAYLDSKEAFTG